MLCADGVSAGYSLSDRALSEVVRDSSGVVHEGRKIKCRTEKDIFDALGLEYKRPEQRSV
jgi:DNA polymerase/3'-5' exonuclease PolX